MWILIRIIDKQKNWPIFKIALCKKRNYCRESHKKAKCKKRVKKTLKKVWQKSKKVYNAFPLSRTTTNINQALMQIFKNQYGQSVWALGRGTKKRSAEGESWRSTKNQNLYFRRVWSWLRLNAGGRPNTCKSNGNMKKACFFWWRVADGWVRFGKLPDRGGQQLETTANTAYSREVKGAIRYQMCPNGIS